MKANIQKIDIYQFNRFQDVLNAYYLQAKSESTGGFSLNKWSAKMGYQSPRVIAMAMKGQRAPSEELQEKLADYLSLKGNKRKYFELLRKKAVLEFKGDDALAIEQAIAKINPSNLQLTPIDTDQFEYISDWHHLVIKQMTKLKSFRNNLSAISTRLKNKVCASKVDKSIELLKRLGHIKSINNGMLVHSSPIKTGNSIPSIAIKRHHEGMLDRAKEALFEEDMNRRHFSSVTLAFSQADITEAKKMIEEFLNEFDARFMGSENTPDDVYQINIQLFPHTKEARNSDG